MTFSLVQLSARCQNVIFNVYYVEVHIAFYQRTLLGTSANQKRQYLLSYNNFIYINIWVSCGILKSLKIDLRNKGISMVNIVSFCLSSLCPKTALFECFNFPLNYINNTLGCSDVLVLANNYIFTLKTRITVKYSFFFYVRSCKIQLNMFWPNTDTSDVSSKSRLFRSFSMQVWYRLFGRV